MGFTQMGTKDQSAKKYSVAVMLRVFNPSERGSMISPTSM